MRSRCALDSLIAGGYDSIERKMIVLVIDRHPR